MVVLLLIARARKVTLVGEVVSFTGTNPPAWTVVFVSVGVLHLVVRAWFFSAFGRAVVCAAAEGVRDVA